MLLKARYWDSYLNDNNEEAFKHTDCKLCGGSCWRTEEKTFAMIAEIKKGMLGWEWVKCLIFLRGISFGCELAAMSSD